MRGRGLLLAALLLAVLGGLAWWSEKTKKAEDEKGGATAANKLVTVKDEDVRKVEIARKDSTPVVLEKNASGSWEMKAPEPLRVDQEAANSVVSSFTGVTSDRVVEDKATDLTSFGLQSPVVEVRLTTKDGKAHNLLLGDETPTSGSYFAKLGTDAKVFTVYSSVKSSLDKSPADLRDKRLLTFDSEKLTRVELNAKGQTVEFGKNAQGEWQILKPRPLRAENGQVEELVRKLKDAKMETAASSEDAKKAASLFGAGTRVASVSTTDAAGTQQLEVRKNAKENAYYAKSSVVEGIHKVPNDLGEGLDKGVDDFRNKKLFDFGFNDPNKVEVRTDKFYSFVKSGDKWFSNGKAMDVVGIQSLIDKLRDLSSIKFVDSGFGTPSIELTVHSNEGKRIEKVQISKSGNQYFARRENEPALYELDAKAVEELQRAAADVKEPPAPTPAKK